MKVNKLLKIWVASKWLGISGEELVITVSRNASVEMVDDKENVWVDHRN